MWCCMNWRKPMGKSVETELKVKVQAEKEAWAARSKADAILPQVEHDV